MARDRKYWIGGVNVRVHTEHAATEYKDLWFTLFKSEFTYSRGSTVYMIGEAALDNEENPDGPIVGYIYRFLNIDPNEPWFNIKKNKPATDDEVSKVSIPNNLKPNLTSIPYVFLPNKHTIYFVSKSTDAAISPKTVHKLLSVITSRQIITDKFGKVDLSVLTDQGKINEFWKWKSIKKLRIFIERPNPIEEDDEKRFYEQLNNINAGSVDVEYTKSQEAMTLKPDQKVKKMATIASDNGEVKVTGVNAKGLQDEASSKDFPMHKQGTYNPSTQGPLGALISFVVSNFLPPRD